LPVALILGGLQWSPEEWNCYVDSVARHARKRAQLVLYPELSLHATLSEADLVNRVRRSATKHGVAVIEGCYVLDHGEKQIVSAYNNPDPDSGEDALYVYRKHSQSDRLAFDNPEWISEFEDHYLRPVRFRGRRLGLTVCHDQTISLLQRSLVRRGADVLLNPSFDDVVLSKWARWLRCRALENGVPVVCSMFSSEGGTRRGYAFAFGPCGEPLPLEFVPFRGRGGFTAMSPEETELRLDGYYLARVPPALATPRLPSDRMAPSSRRISLAGVRRRGGAERTTLEIRNAPWSIGTASPPASNEAIALGSRTIIAVLVPAAEIFRPEAVARAILRAERAHGARPGPLYLLVNAWSRLPAGEEGENLRLVARARGLEHAAQVALVPLETNQQPEAYGSTLYRLSHELALVDGAVPVELDGNKLQGGGPGWFFSNRQDNDFRLHRLAYEALLLSCEKDNGEAR